MFLYVFHPVKISRYRSEKKIYSFFISNMATTRHQGTKHTTGAEWVHQILVILLDFRLFLIMICRTMLSAFVERFSKRKRSLILFKIKSIFYFWDFLDFLVQFTLINFCSYFLSECQIGKVWFHIMINNLVHAFFHFILLFILFFCPYFIQQTWKRNTNWSVGETLRRYIKLYTINYSINETDIIIYCAVAVMFHRIYFPGLVCF
jgi:hypothetical protein